MSRRTNSTVDKPHLPFFPLCLCAVCNPFRCRYIGSGRAIITNSHQLLCSYCDELATSALLINSALVIVAWLVLLYTSLCVRPTVRANLRWISIDTYLYAYIGTGRSSFERSSRCLKRSRKFIRARLYCRMCPRTGASDVLTILGASLYIHARARYNVLLLTYRLFVYSHLFHDKFAIWRIIFSS